jgi:hypothetical protein
MARLRSVPSQFAMCRVFQHAWKYVDVQRDGKVLIQSLSCMRCETMRFVRIDSRDGVTLSAYYRYPEGYQMVGGHMLPAERSAARLSEVKSNLKGVG